jgi:cellulose synthase/poly-beta-1,6-N-acetylglucosamine synthase-like glycosyltransferase
MFDIATTVIIAMTLMNLARMVGYLVGSDIYTIRQARAKDKDATYQPSVSLMVPAHNEGPVVERTLTHLLRINYRPLQIIVVDDGSTDDTLARILAWKAEHDIEDRIEVLTGPNGGKAHALNNAIRARATGELIMCLDGDSILAPDGVAKSVAYFRDRRVVASASNVNILPDGTLIGFIQRFEYLVNHHMKKAQTALNLEYIIGGIGSMFRRSVLDEVNFYDTNTMTEDIDLTLKIIARKGNRDARVVFAADSLVYTEAVPSWASLIKQRTRWKYGRTQAFYKNWQVFFSLDRKHGIGLSWFALPTVVVQELLGILEPLMLAFIVGVGIIYRSPATILAALSVMTVFNAINILGNSHLTGRTKLLMVAAAPLMYLGFYAITIVEYVALAQVIRRIHRLPASVSQEQVTWVSPERSGAALEAAA